MKLQAGRIDDIVRACPAKKIARDSSLASRGIEGSIHGVLGDQSMDPAPGDR